MKSTIRALRVENGRKKGMSKVKNGLKRLREKHVELRKIASEIKFEIIKDFRLPEAKHNQYAISVHVESIGQSLFNSAKQIDSFIDTTEALMEADDG